MSPKARHREALELATAIDDDHLRATHDQLAGNAVLQGDVDGAREHVRAAADLHRATGDQEGLAYCRTNTPAPLSRPTVSGGTPRPTSSAAATP